MRSSLLYILLVLLAKKNFSQPDCIINGSINTISNICASQSSTLSMTYGVNFECWGTYYLAPNFQTGLMAYYTFCGNCQDESGNSAHLYCGTTSLTTDRFGNSNLAYDFNGTYSNMQFAPGVLGNSARTITMWFYDRRSLSTGPDSIASCLYCYGSNPPGSLFQILHMSPSYGGVMKIDFIGTNVTSTIAAGFNSWQFFAFAMDAASNYTAYINGSVVASGTVNINTGTGPSMIGVTSLSGPVPKYWFNGKMDDFYFYSRALSSTEIMQLYNVNTLPVTYTWSTGATTSSIIVTPSVSTVYTMSATNGFYSCTASSTVNVSACTGIEELSDLSSVQLYPNPVISKISLKPEIEISEANVEIRNILGELVLVIPYAKEMDVSKLSPGVYILNLSTENQRYNYRFVKE